MKRLSALFFIALLFSATPSHAFFDTFDKWFTFRENQKPLVTPTKKVTPNHVIVPDYNDEAAAEWARYYTRNDLQAVDYIDGSSKVMRTTAPQQASRPARTEPLNTVYETAPPQATAPQQNWQQPYGQPVPYPYHYYQGHPAGYAPYAQPSPYQMMQWRHQQNLQQQARATENTLYIGEAGTSPDYTSPEILADAQADLGVKTQIDSPAHGWKSPVNGFTKMAPTPGDYNYVEPTPAFSRRPLMDDSGENGRVIAGDGANSGRGAISGSDGFPMEYTVRGGDNLSTISEQDQIYGNWQMWPLIYNANKNQIKDPDLIYPNQRLGIPRDYSDSDAQAARQEAVRRRPPFSLTDGQ